MIKVIDRLETVDDEWVGSFGRCIPTHSLDGVAQLVEALPDIKLKFSLQA